MGSVYCFEDRVRKCGVGSAGFVVAVTLLAGCSTSGYEKALQNQANAAPSHVMTQPEKDYREHVYPVLKANCYRCHAGMNHRGGLRMDTRAALMKGGDDGVVVIAGRPEDSLLIKLVRHEGPAGDPMPMPPKKKLSDEDIRTLTAWVKSGAAMPDGPLN